VILTTFFRFFNGVKYDARSHFMNFIWKLTFRGNVWIGMCDLKKSFPASLLDDPTHWHIVEFDWLFPSDLDGSYDFLQSFSQSTVFPYRAKMASRLRVEYDVCYDESLMTQEPAVIICLQYIVLGLHDNSSFNKSRIFPLFWNESICIYF